MIYKYLNSLSSCSFMEGSKSRNRGNDIMSCDQDPAWLKWCYALFSPSPTIFSVLFICQAMYSLMCESKESLVTVHLCGFSCKCADVCIYTKWFVQVCLCMRAEKVYFGIAAPSAQMEECFSLLFQCMSGRKNLVCVFCIHDSMAPVSVSEIMTGSQSFSHLSGNNISIGFGCLWLTSFPWDWEWKGRKLGKQQKNEFLTEKKMWSKLWRACNLLWQDVKERQLSCHVLQHFQC